MAVAGPSEGLLMGLSSLTMLLSLPPPPLRLRLDFLPMVFGAS